MRSTDLGGSAPEKLCAALLISLLGACYTGASVQQDALDEVGSSGPEPTGGDGDSEGSSTGDPVPSACAEMDGADVGPTPALRLTQSQYANAVRDLLNVEADIEAILPEDETLGVFASNALTSVTELQVEQYMNAAEAAAEAAADANTLPTCEAEDGECVAAFTVEFGRRAFRRPLSDEQLSMYTELYGERIAQGDSSQEAMQTTVAAILQSPSFLYRIEQPSDDLSDDLVALDDFALATRMSFFLWNSIPDDALLDVAENAELSETEMLRRQAERMLEDPRAERTIRQFHQQWLGLRDSLEKSEAFDDFGPDVAKSMVDESLRFADHVIRRGDGRLSTLLTASYTLLDERLVEFYGIDPGSEWSPETVVELDPTQRSGLLTHPSFLATHAHFDRTSPVSRGLMIRERLLCQTPPPPPPDIDVEVPDVSPDTTVREQLERHREDPACAGCHVLFDPLGLGFEHYDAVGRFRANEAGMPVDASGEVTATSDIDGAFDGAVELSEILASSDQVRSCVAETWLQFALGRGLDERDECSAETIRLDFTATDGDVGSLLVAIVLSDSFRNFRPYEGD